MDIGEPQPVERAGWFTEHPVSGRPVHVVTREWFDEVSAALQAAKQRAKDAEDERDERIPREFSIAQQEAIVALKEREGRLREANRALALRLRVNAIAWHRRFHGGRFEDCVEASCAKDADLFKAALNAEQSPEQESVQKCASLSPRRGVPCQLSAGHAGSHYSSERNEGEWSVGLEALFREQPPEREER